MKTALPLATVQVEKMTGVGEVPGGQKITAALEAVEHLVIGSSIGDYKQTLNKVRSWHNENIKDDVRGLQTFDLRTSVHVVTAIEAPLLDLLGKYLDVPAAALMGGVLEPEQELEAVRAIKNAFPDARVDLDPNGCWPLSKALELAPEFKKILAYCEDPCGAEGRFSGREIMAEFKRAPACPPPPT